MITIKRIKIPKRFRVNIYFTIIYTLIFLIFRYTFIFTFPFLLAFFIAMLIQPINKFMRKKLNFKSGFAATVITSLIFLSVLTLIGFTVFILIKESISFLSSFSLQNITENKTVNSFFTELSNHFDFSNISQIIDIFASDTKALKSTYDYLMSFIGYIPSIITMVLVAVFSTFYFINEFDNIKKGFFNLLPKKHNKTVKRVFYEGKISISKCVKGFFIIYSLTFVESLFIFIVLDIKHFLFFAFLSMIADVIPILGPGTIYLPLALAYLLQGRYFVSLVLIICWVALSVLRQIIEPKIISNSIKIHPLIVISSLYLSLLLKSFWIFIYILLYAVIYQVLIKAEVIYPLSKNKHKKE